MSEQNYTETSNRKLISYIFPVYNESLGLEALNSEIMKIIPQLEDKYSVEVVFVNDGSTDDSLTKLKEMQLSNGRYRVLSFSRNFGHQIAITAGIDYARGDALIIMDSDLQDPLAVSLELVSAWEKGYEVVYAQRISRQDGILKKLTAHIFYRLLSTLADIDIPKDTGDFRLIDHKVAVELRKYRERNRFMRGIVAYVGFKQTAVKFNRAERYAGQSHYPIKKMIRLALDGITSFSSAPIKLVSNTGLFLLSFSTLILIVLFSLDAILSLDGITSEIYLALYFSILSGLNITALGVIGEYIARIYSEVQQRPLYIVSEVIES